MAGISGTVQRRVRANPSAHAPWPPGVLGWADQRPWPADPWLIASAGTGMAWLRRLLVGSTLRRYSVRTGLPCCLPFLVSFPSARAHSVTFCPLLSPLVIRWSTCFFCLPEGCQRSGTPRLPAHGTTVRTIPSTTRSLESGPPGTQHPSSKTLLVRRQKGYRRTLMAN